MDLDVRRKILIVSSAYSSKQPILNVFVNNTKRVRNENVTYIFIL